MDLTRYVDQLRQQLAVAAAAGGDEAEALADRLTAPLDAAARLVLLDALADAAGEISVDLAPGAVDVRLRGGSPEFVVTAPPVPSEAHGSPAPETLPDPEPVTGADAESGATSRTTLRLPDHLKAQVEIAAAGDGLSVNTWLVRAVAAALEQRSGAPAPQPRRQQRSTGRVTGWVR